MTVLFTAGAKLLGVYFVYLTLVYLINAALLADGDRRVLTIQLLLSAVTGVIALLLMLRTGSVGRFLGVHRESSPSERFQSPVEVVEVGVVLIGIFVFLMRLAALLHIISARLAGVRFGGFGGAALRIAIEAVPLALAMYAVLRADRVADRLTARLRQT